MKRKRGMMKRRIKRRGRRRMKKRGKRGMMTMKRSSLMTNPENAQLIHPPITIMGSTLVRFPFIMSVSMLESAHTRTFTHTHTQLDRNTLTISDTNVCFGEKQLAV